MATFVNIKPEAAIYNGIIADTTLTAKLATYKTKPAVFFSLKVPEDASYPYIWSPGRVATSITDTKQCIGESFLMDLFVVMEDTGSLALLQEITRKLKAALHRKDLTLTGGNQVLCLVSGPVPAPLAETLVGTILTLEYQFSELN